MRGSLFYSHELRSNESDRSNVTSMTHLTYLTHLTSMAPAPFQSSSPTSLISNKLFIGRAMSFFCVDKDDQSSAYSS